MSTYGPTGPRFKYPTPSLAWVLASMLLLPLSANAQEEELAVEGGLVDFVRDVRPIFDAKCIVCHGPEDAKNDFRMDELDSVMGYVEPGDLESSSLWADYLVTDDPDMRMPPPGNDRVHDLTGAELATIKLWIEEGALWVDVAPTPRTEAEVQAETIPASTLGKVWKFQGLFHPASVHFPIALLMVSTLFVFLSFFNRASCEPVAFHCLWIGALGAVGACVMGWSYAEHEGYGAGFSFDLQNSAIDRHRWAGIAMAVLSLALLPVASTVRRKGSSGMRFTWLVGSVLAAGLVSLTGYQGGELIYGEDHYEKEFTRLFVDSSVDAHPDDAGVGVVEAEVVEEVIAEEEVLDQEVAEPETPPLAEPEPATETPVAEEPATEEEPVTEEPVTEEPATNEPVSEEPVSEEPKPEPEPEPEPASPEEPVSDSTQPVADEPPPAPVD